MKKLFIGPLIVAAGATIFFLLQKNDKQVTTTNFQQERIIGQSKLNSIHFVNDSNDYFLSGSSSLLLFTKAK